MKILVERVTAAPQHFSFEGSSFWWKASIPPEHGLPTELDRPFAIECDVHTMGEELFLSGDIEGAIELECGRCLARYRHGLRESFRLILEPARDRIPSDPEAAAALSRDGISLGDEIESGWYRGSEVDLAHFFLEVVALALPVVSLCRESCEGLCSNCGADLNTDRCGCAQTNPASPFAVLAELRDRPSGATGGKG